MPGTEATGYLPLSGAVTPAIHGQPPALPADRAGGIRAE